MRAAVVLFVGGPLDGQVAEREADRGRLPAVIVAPLRRDHLYRTELAGLRGTGRYWRAIWAGSRRPRRGARGGA